MDYTKYKFTLAERIIVLGKSMAATIIVSYLFYDSLFGLMLFPIIFIFLCKLEKEKKIQERKDKLTGEFIDFLKNISTALLAGYSMENAWMEAQKELGLLHGTESILFQELKAMNHAIMVNVPVENVLDEFASRTGIEEISSFSEIFSYAKKSGGDFVRIIDTTTSRISRKYETFREIEVSMASKKLEQNIMNFVPLFILAYMKLSSPDYMGVLYEGMAGKVVMTTCLLVYGGALVLAEKIINISA